MKMTTKIPQSALLVPMVIHGGMQEVNSSLGFQTNSKCKQHQPSLKAAKVMTPGFTPP